MRSIAVVTDNKNSKVAKFLRQNLEWVFEQYVDINNYSFGELEKGKKIEDDVVLIMIKERALEIKKYVSNKQKIIVIQRTIRENEIYKIFSIPEATEVLVVNDNMETTLETTSLFYQLGINHLNFIPFDPSKKYENIQIAITPGEIQRVPSYIKKIIDVDERCIDLSTFMKISETLDLDSKEIGKNIIKYSEKIISLDNGIKNKYKEIIVKNEELDTIINLSRDGIVFTSNKGIITVCNKSFKKMLNIEENIEGKNIKEFLKFEFEKILKEELIENEVIKYKGKYFNVNKTSISHFGRKTGTYYNIQEVTYIKQLEQNLSKKIREKGQVARYTFQDLKTNSHVMKECVNLAKKISKSDLTVLIIGESGTGKELMAQSIHNKSNRCKQPFVAVNCAAMPENLLESELFGYEPGAFTGALKEGKKGLFEQANNGTIFLDEIGDMPVLLQTKLLRVLQERQVMRVGSQKVIDVNVRVIAATNRNLLNMIKEGKFREDLYYRLNILPINIPPLRERKSDVISMLELFLDKKLILDEEVKKALMSYDWPGNIRELQNAASYISLMCNDVVRLDNLPFNVTHIKDNFNKEIDVLKCKCDFSKCIKVLKIIDESNSWGKSIGRNCITKIALQEGFYLTEGETRKILTELRNLELICSSVGRKGSEITYKGKKFLQNLKS
ncbi:sigma 54-interacting transcriptional regulator [Haloimpatiens sp. FM7330]|uniref:sigma 54-interacting transcriptional regulator n=1 Tax=Haloimpatiens sp. FM7330 TaxID=3298610 RepID=UPI0036358FE2